MMKTPLTADERLARIESNTRSSGARHEISAELLMHTQQATER